MASTDLGWEATLHPDAPSSMTRVSKPRIRALRGTGCAPEGRA